MQNGITVGSEVSTLLNEENLDVESDNNSDESLENTVKIVDITENNVIIMLNILNLKANLKANQKANQKANHRAN